MRSVSLALAATTALSALACRSGPAVKPSVVIRTATGAAGVEVELARTEKEREVGLMHRRSLPPDSGMLFLFPGDEPRTFWMHETLLTLDMIFVSSDLAIVSIVAMAEPQTDTARKSVQPARYVLEVNGGWAATHGVKPGDRVELNGVWP